MVVRLDGGVVVGWGGGWMGCPGWDSMYDCCCCSCVCLGEECRRGRVSLLLLLLLLLPVVVTVVLLVPLLQMLRHAARWCCHCWLDLRAWAAVWRR